jgi:hypothetical protein
MQKPEIQPPQNKDDQVGSGCHLAVSTPRVWPSRRNIYSPPMWAPFSATERHMNRTNATNRTATAAENENTSK